jgi:hypothetical protein
MLRSAARFIGRALTPFGKALNILSNVGGLSLATLIGAIGSPLWGVIAGLSLLAVAVVVHAVREGERAQALRAEEESRWAKREAELLAQLDVRAKRKAVRDQVARFLADGEALYGRVWEDARPGYPSGPMGYFGPIYSKKDWGPEWHAWASQVTTYLRQELGQSYVDLFLSRAGLGKLPHHGAIGFLSSDHTPTLNSLGWCLARLEQLVRELPNE